MNNINIVEALSQIAREKNVDRRLVIETLTDALVSAAKKRFVNADNFEVQLNADTGHMAVLARKTVVEEVNEPELEIDLEDARQIDKQAQLGSVVFEELNLADFGRNAIQAAKQILIQRVREAERDRIYDEFSGRLTQIESGIVQQISHGDIIMNLGRAEAAIPLKEQIRRERYRQGGQRSRVYLRSSEVEPGPPGAAFAYPPRVPAQAVLHRGARNRRRYREDTCRRQGAWRKGENRSEFQ